MPDGYCEVDDVQTALQEESLSGPVQPSILKDDIAGVSSWLRKHTGRHWYDSGGGGDLVPTDARAASNIRLDVPNSPHAQRGQIHREESGVRYPVTTAGPYAVMTLPHGYVDTLQRLAVRDRAGGVTDWTSDSEYVEGRGEDYYVEEQDQEGHGRSRLYIRAAAIGARRDWGDLLTLDYEYGLDAAAEDWQDVRRGVALLTAAQVVVDDDVLTQIPDDGQLVGVDTKAQRLMDRGLRYLEPYLGGSEA